MLTINGIFYSVQGESTYAERPCVFARLPACDLVRYPVCISGEQEAHLEDVVQEVEAYDCPLVEVNSGEPLLQDAVYPLIESLLARGKIVPLEDRLSHK